MSKIIENFYKSEVDFCQDEYMDLFDKDFDHKKSYDFFQLIMENTLKNYDTSIFEEFPNLAKSLFIKDSKIVAKKTAPKLIENSKKFDWNTKKYK